MQDTKEECNDNRIGFTQKQWKSSYVRRSFYQTPVEAIELKNTLQIVHNTMWQLISNDSNQFQLVFKAAFNDFRRIRLIFEKYCMLL